MIMTTIQNQYNQFTSLARILFSHSITHLTVVGLALDYCVQATVEDARKFGFSVDLVVEGTKAVDPGRTESVLQSLQDKGVRLI